MNAMEADALAGAGLTPAIDRLRLSIELAPSFGGGVRLSPEFAQSLIALMERCRETQEYLNEQLAELESAAARYRFLRDATDPDMEQPYCVIDKTNDWGNSFNEWATGQALDETVDAAIVAALKEKS